MDLISTKVLVLVLLLLIKLFSGLAPLFLTKIFKKRGDRFLKKFIGVALCFGGGVLLSTVLVHMLMEVRESLERAMRLGIFSKKLEYPLAELLIGLGFLLILLIESVVHKFFGDHGHGHFPTKGKETPKEEEPFTKKVEDEDYMNVNFECGNCPVSQGHVYHAAGSTCESLEDICESNVKNVKVARMNHVLTSLRSFLVVLALSIHSLFEGMAIGLEESDSGVWKLLMAIAIHAIPIVFCVGTDMISSGVKKLKVVIYMIVLSINSPIGILIGIIVTMHMEQASGQHVLIIGVLQGLAAGTLLYITFFEVLARDKMDRYGMSGLLGAVAIILGFSVMAGLEATGGHCHDLAHHGHTKQEIIQSAATPENMTDVVKF